MSMVSELPRLVRTLWYVPPRAIGYRLLARAKRLFYTTPLYGLGHLREAGPFAAPDWVGVELIPGNPTLGQELARGVFTFVGVSIRLGQGDQGVPRSWLPPQASALWVFHLHYHEWLADMRAAGQREAAQKLVADWLVRFGTYQPVAWHPYPTSLRLVAWLTHGAWLLEGADDDLCQAFYESLQRQAVYLAGNLERDLGGNHFLKNLKALVYAGLALEEHELTTQGLAELLRELTVQVLPDGMHYELSPLYTAQVLRDMLELRAVLRKAGGGAPKPIEDAVRAMGTALGVFVHPDGRLALFNDGAEMDDGLVGRLLRLSGAGDAPETLPDAGYARLERGGMTLIFDAGKVGPDENPGHAHADTLSFELSVGRERVIVNGGTYAYQHPLRTTLRGTAAHSTVSIEGGDSAEVWGSFRVGRRPQQVEMVLQDGAETLPGGDIWVEGRHDGYRWLGAMHRRRIVMAGDGSRLRGEDEITLRSARRVRGHFHLHPDVNVRLLSDTTAELVTGEGVKLMLTIEGGRLDVRDSRYAPQFGKMMVTKQLMIHGRVSQKTCRMAWQLVRV